MDYFLLLHLRSRAESEKLTLNPDPKTKTPEVVEWKGTGSGMKSQHRSSIGIATQKRRYP